LADFSVPTIEDREESESRTSSTSGGLFGAFRSFFGQN